MDFLPVGKYLYSMNLSIVLLHEQPHTMRYIGALNFANHFGNQH